MVSWIFKLFAKEIKSSIPIDFALMMISMSFVPSLLLVQISAPESTGTTLLLFASAAEVLLLISSAILKIA
jgi:hypothetical protein